MYRVYTFEEAVAEIPEISPKLNLPSARGVFEAAGASLNDNNVAF